MARKKSVALTLPVRKFILEKITDGMHLSEICRQFSDKVPTESGVHKYAAANPLFKTQMRDAYTILFTRKIDEYDSLSRLLLASQEDDRWAIKRIEIRLKTLEYQLKVIAPIVANSFTPVPQAINVNHSGTVNKTINIVDYSKIDTHKPALLPDNTVIDGDIT